MKHSNVGWSCFSELIAGFNQLWGAIAKKKISERTVKLIFNFNLDSMFTNRGISSGSLRQR